MFGEFKKFILRGNVVDLAVGIIIGASFSNLVNALVKDMITPIVSAITGKSQFKDSYFTIHGAQFAYGDFLNNLISFILVALVVFFLVVQPINHLTERFMRGKETDDEATRKCPECLSEIPKAATRCKFCAAKVAKEGNGKKNDAK